MPEPTGSIASPFLSVLMPAWNAEAGIGRALDSVLAVADVDLECIVVDDGSTDATAAIVEHRAGDEPRIRLIRMPSNEGVSAARNAGLDVARGTWLAFLDADDRLLPGGLEALIRAAVTRDPLVVIGQRVWTDGERRWVTKRYDNPDVRQPGRKSIATHPGLLYYASATGRLIHRSCIEGLRFEGRILGDQPWTIRAMLRAGDRIEVIADDVYEWLRPKPKAFMSSITVEARFSAAKGAVAVRTAVGAHAAVAAEATRQIPDDGLRDRVVAAYFERLVRSDISVYLEAALQRRHDPGLPELLDEIDAFLRAAPPGLVAGSGPVARTLLLPPLRRWAALQAPARAAWRRMARTSLDLRDATGRPGQGAVRRSRGRVWWAVRLAGRGGALGPWLTWLGLVCLGLVWRRGIRSRVRRIRRRVGR
jgi:hypothetical protein